MKIFSISIDPSICDPASKAAERAVWYGNMLELLTILVPNTSKGRRGKDSVTDLSDSVTVIELAGKNKLATLIRLYRQAKVIMEHEQYDLITVQDIYYVGLLGAFLSLKFNCPLEVQVHGMEKFRGFRKLLARKVISYAAGIRTVSQRLKTFLMKEFSLPEGSISVVPVFADIRSEQQDETLKLIDKENGEFVFLTVSRLVPVKHISLQIAALKKILINYPNTQLWIVGDGPKRKDLEKQAEQLDFAAKTHFKDQVKFFGQIDPKGLPGIYSSADAFLLTSDSEGWGMVVIEAASYGLPIIMTDVGCAGEFLKDAQNGVIIPVGDSKALEQAMKRILDDGEFRKRIGDAAKLAASQLPSKDEIVARYKEGWEKIVSEKTAEKISAKKN